MAVPTESSSRRSALGVMAVAVISHPSLWITAIRQVRILAPNGWWRRAPYLPLPDAEYLRFRMVTAYGGEGVGQPTKSDVVTYLRWCRAWPDAAR